MRCEEGKVTAASAWFTRCRIILSLLLLFAASTMGSAAESGSSDDILSFLVIGDWGERGSSRQYRVARAMDREAPQSAVDFIFTTGDNFYPAGVDSADAPAWKKNFENVYSQQHLRRLPWYVSLGNHDYMGDIRAQIDYSRVNPRWNLPAAWYSRAFETGETTAEFFVLDTTALVEFYHTRPEKYHHIEEQDPGAQLNWLRRVLALSNAHWKIVIGHHPVYSSGRHHGDTVDLKAVLPSLFKSFNVAAYFSGHDHHLEHFKPDGNTHYFISGGGAGHRSTRNRAQARFAAASSGFARVELTPDAMRVAFIDEKGEQLYEVKIPSAHTEKK